MGNKTLKVTMTKKNKISKASKFSILAYTGPEIENLEISDNFHLLQFLVVQETQNPTTRKMTSNKKM